MAENNVVGEKKDEMFNEFYTEVRRVNFVLNRLDSIHND